MSWFQCSKTGHFVNDLDFEWDLKSGRLTIGKAEKWLLFCREPKIWSKTSGFPIACFQIVGTISKALVRPFENCTIWYPFFKKYGFIMVSFQIPIGPTKTKPFKHKYAISYLCVCMHAYFYIYKNTHKYSSAYFTSVNRHNQNTLGRKSNMLMLGWEKQNLIFKICISHKNIQFFKTS